jgi:hypothetical protein
MSKDQIKTMGAMPLFKLVFGQKPGQTLSEFASECSKVRNDEAFVAETREYALANCATA